MDIQQRISEVQKEIREIPYHKGTEHHIGRLRARIAKLRDEEIERQTNKSGGGGGYAVKKAGDATVVLVGPPSVGKSTLLNGLTNAKSPVAPYAFTTVTVIPGMMNYKGARIQILDVPGLIKGAARGRGRGREVLSVVRGSDLLIFITEVGKESQFEEMETELYEAGIRVNTERPKIKIEKKLKGGLLVHSSTIQPFDNETVKTVAQEFGLRNAEITLKEKFTLEKLVDAFTRDRVYVGAIYVVNKVDSSLATSSSATSQVETSLHLRGVKLISARMGLGLMELREAIWDKLKFIRVYLAKGGKVQKDEPMIVKDGDTLGDVAHKIGTEFASGIKGAKISGPGAKFPNQEVPLRTLAQDRMEVTFF